MADNALIYYIVGDDGASAEGSINGCFNEMSYFNGLQALETSEYLTERLDMLGGPGVVQPLRRGLGVCDEHAYQWTKQVASHWVARNGMWCVAGIVRPRARSAPSSAM